MALRCRAGPILVLDVAHKRRIAFEKTGDAKVVDHIEQAELGGIGKGRIIRKTLAELRVKESEMVQKERVDCGMRQSWGGRRAIKGSGIFAGRKSGDSRVFGFDGIRSGRLVVSIHEGERESTSRGCKQFADGDRDETLCVQVHPGNNSFKDFKSSERVLQVRHASPSIGCSYFSIDIHRPRAALNAEK